MAGEALLPGAGIVDQAVLWQGGSLTDLGTLGGQQSAALGINNAGTICGWADTASGNTVAALWNGGAVTALPTLGGASGTAWGINDAGAAVGYSYLSTGGYHATLWSGGGVQDLGTLGGSYSIAYDINNQGAVVGTASNSAGQDRAVLWGPGGVNDLGALSGGQWTAASEINNSGQVILWGTPLGATDDRAAFWNGNPSSPVISLGTFGGSQSWAYGLNDQGYVVGSADEPGGTYHAFVWNGTEMVDLGTWEGITVPPTQSTTRESSWASLWMPSDKPMQSNGCPCRSRRRSSSASSVGAWLASGPPGGACPAWPRRSLTGPETGRADRNGW